jgi:tyrosine-specific transport protein
MPLRLWRSQFQSPSVLEQLFEPRPPVGTSLVEGRVSSLTDEEQGEPISGQPFTTEALPIETQIMEDIQGQVPNTKNGLFAFLAEKMGTVDDDRIIHPELSTGEVPRLFSSLDYSRCEQGRVTSAVHAAGSTVGAAALVAGTTVGAGVLALPTATASAGFLPSTAALVMAWGYMTVSGLLIAELSMNRLAETGRPGSGVLDLFQSNLGKGLGSLGSAAYFFLHYAMMVAYIAQGGVNLDGLLSNIGLESLASSPGLGQMLFASTAASALFFSKPSLVEKANNAMVLGVIVTFLGIIGLGASSADFSQLVDPVNQHPEHIVDVFPISFLALVYQNVVPTIVTQLEGDRNKIIAAIVGGTAVPLLMFLAWNGVILGNLLAADPSAMASGVDPVALLQSTGHAGPLLSGLVSSFSSLALITSLIGFTYGLVDALTDVADIPSEGPSYEKWKPALFAGVFLPPLALSVANPDIFYDALEYGGAFGVSTLFLVLPPIVAWKVRYGEDTPLATKPMVPGGKIPLGSLWKAAATLIVEQGAKKLGVFDFIQEHLNFLS